MIPMATPSWAGWVSPYARAAAGAAKRLFDPLRITNEPAPRVATPVE